VGVALDPAALRLALLDRKVRGLVGSTGDKETKETTGPHRAAISLDNNHWGRERIWHGVGPW